MVVLAILLSCFMQSVMAQGNLVFNGNFNTSSNGLTPDGWIGGSYDTQHGNPPPDTFLEPGVTASQEINSLTPGQLYIVSGDYSGGSKSAGNSFGVALDNVYLFETVAPPNFNWYSFSFDYTATSTSALLSLSAGLNGTDANYAIDNISMVAVPEPSAISLILLGGGVFLYVRNRQKHSAPAKSD